MNAPYKGVPSPDGPLKGYEHHPITCAVHRGYVFLLLAVANELARLSGLPEAGWDREDYIKQDACVKKLVRIEQEMNYEYDRSWLIEDGDYLEAERERNA